jgi:hypothetical protein
VIPTHPPHTPTQTPRSSRTHTQQFAFHNSRLFTAAQGDRQVILRVRCVSGCNCSQWVRSQLAVSDFTHMKLEVRRSVPVKTTMERPTGNTPAQHANQRFHTPLPHTSCEIRRMDTLCILTGRGFCIITHTNLLVRCATQTPRAVSQLVVSMQTHPATTTS